MAIKYLIDTTALYPLTLKIREDIIDYLDVLAILDLTVYEVGNVIVKSLRRGLIKDVKSVMPIFEDVIRDVHIIRVKEGFSNAVELALKENLTLYDAYYLYIARKEGIKLVTEDRALLKFSEAISTNEMLKNLIRSK